MGRLNYSLKGSTLIETMVAMVLILLITVIATVVIINVSGSNSVLKRLKARVLLRESFSQDSIPQNISYSGLLIKIEKHQIGGIGVFNVQIKDSTGKSLVKRGKIILP